MAINIFQKNSLKYYILTFIIGILFSVKCSNKKQFDSFETAKQEFDSATPVNLLAFKKSHLQPTLQELSIMALKTNDSITISGFPDHLSSFRPTQASSISPSFEVNVIILGYNKSSRDNSLNLFLDTLLKKTKLILKKEASNATMTISNKTHFNEIIIDFSRDTWTSHQHIYAYLIISEEKMMNSDYNVVRTIKIQNFLFEKIYDMYDLNDIVKNLTLSISKALIEISSNKDNNHSIKAELINNIPINNYVNLKY